MFGRTLYFLWQINSVQRIYVYVCRRVTNSFSFSFPIFRVCLLCVPVSIYNIVFQMFAFGFCKMPNSLAHSQAIDLFGSTIINLNKMLEHKYRLVASIALYSTKDKRTNTNNTCSVDKQYRAFTARIQKNDGKEESRKKVK